MSKTIKAQAKDNNHNLIKAGGKAAYFGNSTKTCIVTHYGHNAKVEIKTGNKWKTIYCDTLVKKNTFTGSSKGHDVTVSIAKLTATVKC